MFPHRSGAKTKRAFGDGLGNAFHQIPVIAMANWSAEETDNPLLADDRKFFKVEKWSKDDQHVERMLWAGNSLDKAREIFDAEVKRRPRIPLSARASRCCSASPDLQPHWLGHGAAASVLNVPSRRVPPWGHAQQCFHSAFKSRKASQTQRF